jgi:hypothetical protein
MRGFSNDPRTITAKFDSQCAQTGKKISKGDPCVYYPADKKVYHINSPQAQEFREWKFDIDVLNANY